MAIDYELMSQSQESWGIDATVKFTDSETGIITTNTFRFDDQTQIDNEFTQRMAKAIINLEFFLNVLNDFDLRDNCKEILIALVQYIRNNPDCTLAEMKTAYDTQYPDAIWKAEGFVQKAKEKLQERLGFVPTWEQFKNYVINHKLGGLDG